MPLTFGPQFSPHDEDEKPSDMASHYNQYNFPLDISKFTDLVKLRGPENYEEWRQSIRTAFEEQGVWPLVTGTEQPLLALDTAFSHNEYINWQRLDKSLCALLGMTVDRAIVVDVPENIGIDAMYQYLCTYYQPMPKPQFPQLLKTLSRLRLENFTSISDYSYKFETLKNEMQDLRPNGMPRAMYNTIFLEGLGTSRGWEDFKE